MMQSEGKRGQVPSRRRWPTLLLLGASVAFSLLLTGVGCLEPELDEDHQVSEVARQRSNDSDALRQWTPVESIIGKVMKGVVYTAATLATLNNRLLCTLMASGQPEERHDDEPTLYIFPFPDEPERAFRIYADDEITQDLVKEARLDANSPTMIFVHGWLGGVHNEYWLQDARSTVLAAGEHRNLRTNILLIDWADLAQVSLYTATRNTLLISRRLGKMLKRLYELDAITPETTHCFGHSLGAHVCGQAARIAFMGASVPTDVPSPWRPRDRSGQKGTATADVAPRRQVKMGRITGLDPGGYCYQLNIHNETLYAGLRPSDAHLVDSYHTNRTPFGNKYQVGHYNVRVNNANLQRTCSVWRNASHSAEYFRAAIRFLMGNTKHSDILTCDHYFATQLAKQSLSDTPHCSFVGYACDSYSSFVRGRCGQCGNKEQCYVMDFEYQRTEPSTEHMIEQLAQYSNDYELDDEIDGDEGSSTQPATGSVPYESRLTYHMRTRIVPPLCSATYRVRVVLSSKIVESRWFRSDSFSLRLLDLPLGARDSNLNAALADDGSLRLYGPWPAAADGRTFGLDNRTLTSMFELAQPVKIEHILLVFDNPGGRHRDSVPEQISDPAQAIYIDYLSTADQSVKEMYSRTLSPDDFGVIYKRLPTDLTSRFDDN